MMLPRLKYLLLLLILSGCASLPPNSPHENFADYAESVFRHQNTLISQLMLLNDTEQLPDNEALDHAEEDMHDACHWLNEYAERENDGESMGWRFKAKVQASIEGCDLSIQRMEALLKQFTLPNPKSR